MTKLLPATASRPQLRATISRNAGMPSKQVDEVLTCENAHFCNQDALLKVARRTCRGDATSHFVSIYDAQHGAVTALERVMAKEAAERGFAGSNGACHSNDSDVLASSQECSRDDEGCEEWLGK
jgi:hypothetical protein